MSVRESIICGAAASEHVVQFFDADDSRVECVAAFLAEGFRADEPLVVIARPLNWTTIVERLESLGLPVQSAIGEGSLVVKDAGDTLRRLSRGGWPDPVAFDNVIGKPVAELARRGRVRAYGEMVDILAQ